MILHEVTEGPLDSKDLWDKFHKLMAEIEAESALPTRIYVHPKTMELLRRARRHGLRRYSTWGQRKLRHMSRKQRTVWLQHWNAWKP